MFGVVILLKWTPCQSVAYHKEQHDGLISDGIAFFPLSLWWDVNGPHQMDKSNPKHLFFYHALCLPACIPCDNAHPLAAKQIAFLSKTKIVKHWEFNANQKNSECQKHQMEFWKRCTIFLTKIAWCLQHITYLYFTNFEVLEIV